MGSAYTPGLKVSPRTTIEKVRRLPLKGTVVVQEGDIVDPDTVVARTYLPGLMQTVRMAERLGIEPSEVAGVLQVKVGDPVAVGDLLAETKGLFGKYFRARITASVAGTVEILSATTGHLGIREAPKPIERAAYISGRVSSILPDEGVIVTCQGALIQGIFGVGGERLGEIVVVTSGIAENITEASLDESHRGKIVVGGSQVTGGALRRASEVGVVGIVCGGIIDRDLMDYLAEALERPGYDIGVAITGQEAIPFSLVVTEGFGPIQMATRTFNLLRSLEGKSASINGATQIRAGVIRPEVIVPLEPETIKLEIIKPETIKPETIKEASHTVSPDSGTSDTTGQLLVGTPIRVIREPYFGRLGTVVGLPSELVRVESGTMVRVLQTRLENGDIVTVPRANVEIIEEN